ALGAFRPDGASAPWARPRTRARRLLPAENRSEAESRDAAARNRSVPVRGQASPAWARVFFQKNACARILLETLQSVLLLQDSVRNRILKEVLSVATSVWKGHLTF